VHKPFEHNRESYVRDETLRNHYLANHKAQIMNFIQTTERHYNLVAIRTPALPHEHVNIISNGKAGDPHGKPV